jgi:hypothetical protein
MERGVNGNNLNMCHLTQYAHYPYIEGSDDGKGSGTESEAMRLECGDGRQYEYRGVENKTETGKDCQRWDSQEPHSHTRTPEIYTYGGLEKNYCRNPDGWTAAWCYTTLPSTRWELCSVPDCSLEKWCELTKQEYLSRLAGSQEYVDLNSAKSACYTNDTCNGISKSSDGKYILMTGPLSPTNGTAVTYSKGLCKQLVLPEPVPGDYCKMKNRTLSSWLTSASSLREALQLCDHWESCGGVSGSGNSYAIYASKQSSASDKDSWFKGQCPDLTKCGYGNLADYRGNLSVTWSGKTCQRWDSQTPHSHSRTPENYPNGGLKENYCRNPDGN